MERTDHGRGSAWAFLWGKRRWRRQPTSLTVVLGMEAVTLPAHAVNVSAGGILLRVPKAEVDALQPAGRTADLFALHALFAREFDVRLGPDETARRVEGVRIDWRPEEPDAIFVGCRLAEALEEAEVRALGLEARVCMAEAGSTALPADEMPWQARYGADGILQTRRADAEDWHEGTLLGMHGRNLAFAVHGAEPTGLVADLAHERLQIRTRHGDETVWTAAAWLLSVRLRDDGGLEVVVQTEEEPNEATLALFRVRPASHAV